MKETFNSTSITLENPDSLQTSQPSRNECYDSLEPGQPSAGDCILQPHYASEADSVVEYSLDDETHTYSPNMTATNPSNQEDDCGDVLPCQNGNRGPFSSRSSTILHDCFEYQNILHGKEDSIVTSATALEKRQRISSNTPRKRQNQAEKKLVMDEESDAGAWPRVMTSRRTLLYERENTPYIQCLHDLDPKQNNPIQLFLESPDISDRLPLFRFKRVAQFCANVTATTLDFQYRSSPIALLDDRAARLDDPKGDARRYLGPLDARSLYRELKKPVCDAIYSDLCRLFDIRLSDSGDTNYLESPSPMLRGVSCIEPYQSLTIFLRSTKCELDISQTWILGPCLHSFQRHQPVRPLPCVALSTGISPPNLSLA